MKIGIIGGGIIGLTSGVVLAEAGHNVEIWTKAPLEAVTSWAAGAVSYPFGVEQSERVLSWWVRGDEELRRIMDTGEGSVFQARWRRLSRDETIEAPPWFARFGGTHIVAPDVPAPYKSGITAPYLVMATDRYVAYLKARFAAAGGAYKIKEVMSLDTLPEGFDAWVHATGIDARHLAKDESVYPARGQVVIIKNPGVHLHTALEGRKFYCYPRGEQILLGGSFDIGEWDRTPDDALSAEILAWAAATEPLLAKPEVLDIRVGLRPMRDTVRLETEVLPSGVKLIHNYGHGGAGYTLSWGCAFEVLAKISA